MSPRLRYTKKENRTLLSSGVIGAAALNAPLLRLLLTDVLDRAVGGAAAFTFA